MFLNKKKKEGGKRALKKKRPQNCGEKRGQAQQKKNGRRVLRALLAPAFLSGLVTTLCYFMSCMNIADGIYELIHESHEIIHEKCMKT